MVIEAPASALAERYVLLRRLGQGSYGTVYEALDRNSDQRVALKELSAVNALTITHFKQEFRAMQEVNHPNLVRLDALFEHAGKWRMTMELVEGNDLLTHVYHDAPDCCFDEAQLRHVFGQLCDALQALHASGFVHRDLKPDNVRVTPEGRVVLLDFGLATAADPKSRASSLGGVGTISYMAPEQADGQKVGPAADWYAFGVCLYQAMTGLLPVDGPTPVARLLAKQTRPERASTLAGGVPEDLDALCDALLQLDPEQRPTGRQVRAALAGRARSVEAPADVQTGVTPSQFAGREDELRELECALERALTGKPQLVLVEGESGIGKSSLVERFIALATSTLMLRSRCYESELLGYKAFDGAMGELAEHLRGLPSERLQALVPQRAALLCRMFPAFEAISAIATTPLLGIAADPSLQRFEAFAVFTRLLSQLAQEQPLLLVIDDLQWADAESFALLQVLLAASGVPCLVLATVRPRHELEPEASSAIESLRALPCCQVLSLAGLPRPGAMALARRLMAAETPDAWLEAIVKESAGHPLFLTVLTRFAGTRDPRLHGDITLDLAISTQIGALPAHARQLLDTVAVSGAALPAGLCGRTAGLSDADLGPLITGLCRERLLRRRQAGEIACFHDRIRHVTLGRLSADATRQLHGKLASTLAAHGQFDPAELARHHEAAGELALALDAYRRGAERAQAALAFARAAMLYGRALELGLALHLPQAQSVPLRVARGHALAHAGRSAEAAHEFLQAAQSSEGEAKTQLRIFAAQHLLQSARVAEGMAAAKALLAELGVPLPGSLPAALAQMAWDRGMLKLRGLDTGFARRAAGSQQRMQLDALWGLALPLSWLDTVKAAALSTRHLRVARTVNDSAHMARALSDEAFVRLVSSSDHPEVDRLLGRARALCDDTGDPALDVTVACREGTVAMMRWELRKALARFEHAHRIATERCPDQPWLLTNVRIALGPVWLATGEHAKLATSTGAWLAEAHDRNDQFALALIEGAGCGNVRHLMADDVEQAREALRVALQPWPRSPFGFAHFGEAMATTYHCLYPGGDAAYCWLQRELPRLSEAFIMRMRFGKATLTAWHALACIAACKDQDVGRSKHLRARARALAATLPRADLRLGDLNHALIEAQLDALDGAPSSALAHITRGLHLAKSSDYKVFEIAFEYLRGLLEAGQAGAERRAHALAFFSDQGWKSPQRAVAIWCPAASVLEATR